MTGRRRARLEAVLRETGCQVIERGLTWGTSGNLSGRLDRGRFLISGAGARLDRLGPGHLALCDIAGAGAAVGGRPSVEVEMHRRIYATRVDAGAVLHTSAPWTTLLACSQEPVPTHVNTDGLYYVREVARVPFYNPGSAELAAAAAAAASSADVMLLANHGSLVVAANPPEALLKAEALEFLARLLVGARQAGIALTALSPEQVDAFCYSLGIRRPPAAAEP